MSKGIGDFVILVFKLSISKPDCFIARGVPNIRRVAVTQTSVDHLCALLQTAVPLKSVHTYCSIAKSYLYVVVHSNFLVKEG